MTLALLIFLLQATPFRLSPYGFGNVVPPLPTKGVEWATPVPPPPTEFSLTAFPATKTVCLEWRCKDGHQFEVRVVRDGELQPRVELSYSHNFTNFEWIHVFDGKTNVFAVRRIHPESDWSEEITVTK